MWASRILSRAALPVPHAAALPSRALPTQWIRQSSSSTPNIPERKSRPQRSRSAFSVNHLHPTPANAEEAVSHILYNTSESSLEPVKKRYILNCLSQHEPGVISSVSGILAGRGFNIDSLVGAKTEVADLGRMTIVLRGEADTVEQARRQLEDLVPVWAVIDYSDFKLIQRELLLIKVSILGPEHARAQMRAAFSHGQEIVEEMDSSMPPSEVLRQTQAHLKSLKELTGLFQGNVVDVSRDCAVIELSAKPDRIDAFIKLVKPFGILESERSGVMAMPRSPIYDRHENEEQDVQDEGSKVDASLLPPG